jgi:orotidine-5'-phosphate decarboxylase
MTSPLIVALDFASGAEALGLVRRLGPAIDFYKVGLELFTAAGPEVVRRLTGEGKQVFVDLKMFDIGETVKRAAASVAALGASLLTVHASPQVIRAARQGASGTRLKIVAVTVLTSFDQSDLEDLGVAGRTVAEQVAFLAKQGLEAGVDGFVCSPREAAQLRALSGSDVILVVPGVRSAGAGHDDQKRVATPAEAIQAGASYLVIGREITRAADPVLATRQILTDIAPVWQSMIGAIEDSD